jgi:hypothetical protein
MPPLRAALAARFALPLLLLAAVLGAAGPAGAAECQEGISQGNTQKLFNALNKMKPADGCTLESVGTQRSKTSVVWKKDGHLQDPVVVLPTSCAEAPGPRGKVLSMEAPPPSVAAACPAAVAGMAALIATEAFGGLVALSAGTPGPDEAAQPSPPPPLPGPSRAFPIAGGIAAALLVAAAILTMRRRRSKHDGGGPPASAPPSG